MSIKNTISVWKKKKKSGDLRVGKKDLTTEGNNGEVKDVP